MQQSQGPVVVTGQPMVIYTPSPYHPQPMAGQMQMQMQVVGDVQAQAAMSMVSAANAAAGPAAAAPIQYIPTPATAPAGCPPGLEYLCAVDQLLVHQQVEMLEVLTGFETNEKYQVKNALGQLVYFAVKQINTTQCVPQLKVTIVDNLGRQVMLLDRQIRCSCCCLPVHRVYAPAGKL